MVDQTTNHDADSISIIPESLTNPTPTESKMTQALGTLPLGGTDAGKRWCRKALHPADHSVLSAPVPGGATVPTVSSYYTQVLEVEPASLDEGHVTNWDAEIFLRQDPVCPVSIKVTTQSDYGQASYASFPWLNNQVTSYRPFVDGEFKACDTKILTEAFREFAAKKNFYRMTHAGLTIEHVCSSTTNQGTITSAQYRIEPVNSVMQGYPLTVSAEGNDVSGVAKTDPGHFPLQQADSSSAMVQPVSWFRQQQMREYCEGPMDEMTLLQATNAYTGKAVNGLYVPLKLTNPTKMVNVDQQYLLFGYGTRETKPTDPFKGCYYQHKASLGNSIGWPYYSNLASTDPTGVTKWPKFAEGCRECGPSISHTVIKGLDPHATLRLYLRVGIEFVVETSSPMAAFARAPPLPDTVALQMYQEICSCLKDAYTQDYNDKSRLLEVIDKLAKKIVPAIDKGLNVFAKVPGNPWGFAAEGLRTLTQAYMAPARGASQPHRKARKKGGGSRPAPSALAKTGSTVNLSDGSGGIIKAKVISITKPNGKKVNVKV